MSMADKNANRDCNKFELFSKTVRNCKITSKKNEENNKLKHFNEKITKLENKIESIKEQHASIKKLEEQHALSIKQLEERLTALITRTENETKKMKTKVIMMIESLMI